jgi:hypothetical protein
MELDAGRARIIRVVLHDCKTGRHCYAQWQRHQPGDTDCCGAEEFIAENSGRHEMHYACKLAKVKVKLANFASL